MQYRTTSYAEGVFDIYWFEKNLQGDIVAVYSDAGTLLATYAYDAWGNTVSTTYYNGGSGTIVRNNRFRYRGYYYDTETGFYYLNSRYYDPNTGRFINADGYILTPNGNMTSANMFAYCGNNPVHRYDPSGEFGFTATLGGVAVWKLGVAFVSLVTTVWAVTKSADNSQVLPPIRLPKIEVKSKTEEKSKVKDITLPKSQRQDRDPVHHIVAKADPRAEEARQILRDVGIEPITDPRNLVVLPKSYHVSLHTTAYYNYVTQQLRLVAGDRAGVIDTLTSLRAELYVRSALGIRWD